MATHSSVLAWRIPGTVEPGGLPSMGSHSRTQLKGLSSSSRLGEKRFENRFPVKCQLPFKKNHVARTPHSGELLTKNWW